MMAQLVSSELFLGLFEEANIIKLERVTPYRRYVTGNCRR